MLTFTAHSHPVLAVPCPDCRAAYGPAAEIRQDPDTGWWEIEGADTRVEVRP